MEEEFSNCTNCYLGRNGCYLSNGPCDNWVPSYEYLQRQYKRDMIVMKELFEGIIESVGDFAERQVNEMPRKIPYPIIGCDDPIYVNSEKGLELIRKRLVK